MKWIAPFLFLSSLALATPAKTVVCPAFRALDGRIDNALLLSLALKTPGQLAQGNRDLLPSFERQLRKSVEQGGFEADKYTGKLLPMQEEIPERIVKAFRAKPIRTPMLTPATMKDIEPGKRYIYVVVPDGAGGTTIHLEKQENGTSHRQVGAFREAVSAGEIMFREATLGNGQKLLVIDHVNLQSGLYRPAAIRILDTYRALVAAGLDARQIATGRFDSGETPPKGGENIPIFDFGDHVPLVSN